MFTHTNKLNTPEDLLTVPIGGVILSTHYTGQMVPMMRGYAYWYGIADTENYPVDEVGLPAWYIADPENDEYEEPFLTEPPERATFDNATLGELLRLKRGDECNCDSCDYHSEVK